MVFLRSSCQHHFCLISRATSRLRTSTRSLPPLLMSVHRRGDRFASRSWTHVSSGTPPSALNLPYHAISSACALATPSRRSVTPVSSSVKFPSQSFTYTSEGHSSSSSHTSSSHTMSSSPRPGYNGRLSALIDRISTSLPAELLEAPPVFADSCGGPTAS